MSRHIHRLHIIVPASQQAAANAIAAQITQQPADSDTFSVALSPAGAEPATHYACSIAVTEAERLATLYMMQAAGLTPVAYRCSIVEGWPLVDAIGVDVAGLQGQDWSFSRALEHVGLMRIEEELDNA